MTMMLLGVEIILGTGFKKSDYLLV